MNKTLSARLSFYSSFFGTMAKPNIATWFSMFWRRLEPKDPVPPFLLLKTLLFISFFFYLCTDSNNENGNGVPGTVRANPAQGKASSSKQSGKWMVSYLTTFYHYNYFLFIYLFNFFELFNYLNIDYYVNLTEKFFNRIWRKW